MSIQPVDRVLHFAFILRNADHEAYRAFLEAFDAYGLSVMTDVLNAPADRVLKMQGRAAEVRELLAHLRNPKPLPSNAAS